MYLEKGQFLQIKEVEVNLTPEGNIIVMFQAVDSIKLASDIKFTRCIVQVLDCWVSPSSGAAAAREQNANSSTAQQTKKKRVNKDKGQQDREDESRERKFPVFLYLGNDAYGAWGFFSNVLIF